MNYYQPCLAIFRRDLLLAWRGRSELVNPLMFFSLVVLMFPMGLGTRSEFLQSMAPAIIWVAVLLASIVSLDGLFRSDFEDGSFEQFVITGCPLSLLVLTKLLAHWLLSQVPLIVIAPVFALILQLPYSAVSILLETLLIGTPILSIIGAVGAALTLSFPRSGMLLCILVMPFYIPVLIFACSAIDFAATGLSAKAQIDILLAMLFMSLTLGLIPTCAAIKMSVN